jgi:hypothetical protein
MRPSVAELFCAALLSLVAASASWAGQAPSPAAGAPRGTTSGAEQTSAAHATTSARTSGGSNGLSATEQRWLQGAWPVITHARQTGVPLDVIVQPQPAAGVAPLAMAFVDGRCKLVLSMRGNAQAQATLDAITPSLLDATLELMTAHELGHCRRYLDGAWYGLPAGFVAAARPPAGLNAELQVMYAAMQATRREEAYGDLVGLAWTHQHHPELYPRLHSWLLAERATDLIPGSHHDTLAWLRLAGDGGALAGPSIYAGASALWASGLRLAP